ncbi:TonB-dependent receptor [candidate division KSB1 bacterium]|nr:TonB-dependent receptor [candidate division KSB1 bacterium]
MKRLLICVFLTFILLASNLFAVNGVIKGKLVDTETGDALPGGNVAIKGTTMGAASDLKGYYVIRNVPPGTFTIEVSYIGYKPLELTVRIRPDETVEQDIKLEYGYAVEGELVVVTAQASGQLSAINQQLASNTISNIVSGTRIKELPDVNAAESIGRLPGIAINRSGGEATKISIRGLSPKYNTVTVNGVRVPATGSDDRSVDLSLISSTMLDGIEVKKAITPDMDADALGGTVDLKLKEAPEGMQLSVMAQTGYNRLQDDFGNYNFSSSYSNRFMNNQLGVVASINADEYDRSADKLQANYREKDIKVNGVDVTTIVPQELTLREETVTRGRTGASLLMDYRIPNGKVTGNGFYNRLSSDARYRINRMNMNDNRHYYDLELRGGTTQIFTFGIGIEQDYNWIRYDASFARTYSRTDNPEERTWNFIQEKGAFVTGWAPDENTPLTEISGKISVDTLGTALQDVYQYNTKREEDQYIFQLNFEVPVAISEQINGSIKFGGKLRWLDRFNDQQQDGRNGYQYGNNNGPNRILVDLDNAYPEWGIRDYVANYQLVPIELFAIDYTRDNFLNGDYPFGIAVDENMMNKVTDVLFAGPEVINYAIGSLGNDYKGSERYQAGYIMGNFNIGKYVSLLPGVRWEGDWSEYTGYRFREVSVNNIEGPPADLDTLTVERNNNFWLPMVHLKVEPFDWLKIRLAYTETLTRPDFIQYAPITRINSYANYYRAANTLLKPAHSQNWDLSVSVYQNYVGLFTVSGFTKDIDDLIFQRKYQLKTGIPIDIPGLNIPENWYNDPTNPVKPEGDIYINNPFPATYKGVEFDWQTHFWYLPSVLRGIVLNVNYTYIESKTDVAMYYIQREQITKIPPRFKEFRVDSSRSARVPDQPKHIANVTLGYDFKGFSARLSYLYQTDRTTFIDKKPILDNFSGDYARWDLTLQQKLSYSLQAYANFTNLNNTPDKNFRGSALEDPTYIEYYGFTMDVGLRYAFH